MNIVKQNPKEQFWNDEAGNKVATSILKTSEKAYEKLTFDVAKNALKVSKQLSKLKQQMAVAMDKAIEAFKADYSGKKTEFKGNYTIQNFDGSIRFCISVSNPIKFDDLTIDAARTQLQEFLKDGISAKDDAIKQMILDAFETSRGKLDVKKILSLQRYADRIPDQRYQDAMQLIQSAIRRPATCTYYQIYVRNEQGKYDSIPLSLSDVQ